MTLKLHEAWQHFQAPPLASENIALVEGLGRVLLSPMVATRPHPHVDIAAMDGYGFAATRARATRTLVGTAAAGQDFAGTVGQNECVRILTGASIPEGVTTVAMQEDCSVIGTSVILPEGPEGKCIRQRGGDFAIGTAVCNGGTPLSSRDIAVGLAAGHSIISVPRKVNIAIIATGSELTPPGSSNGTINSNMYALAAGFTSPRAQISRMNVCADEVTALTQAIQQASDVDLLVLSGGVSVGDKDHVLDCLADVGAEMFFHGVMMKPGKPSLYARLGDTHILGLPGNPVSAQVCAALLAKPLLNKLQGITDHVPKYQLAQCLEPLPKGIAREHYLRGYLQYNASGTPQVRLMPNQDSAGLHSLAQANCLVRIPIDAPETPKGGKAAILHL